MDKWLYKVVSVNTEYELNEVDILTGHHPGSEALEKWLNSMSADGWELVSFLPAKPADKTRKRYSEHEWTDSANPWEHYAIFKKDAELAEAQRKELVESERMKRRARGRIST